MLLLLSTLCVSVPGRTYRVRQQKPDAHNFNSKEAFKNQV